MLHRLHKLTKKHTLLQDKDSAPITWSQIEYKIYQGHTLVTLPEVNVAEQTKSLGTLLTTRESGRQKGMEGLSVAKLSSLLRLGVGENSTYIRNSTERKRRTYPSAGGLYPCEVYILLRKDSEELSTGIYHYRFDEHGLEYIAPASSIDPINQMVLDSALQSAVCYVFITCVIGRQAQKYGYRAYRSALLEAGIMGQNLTLSAQSLELQSVFVSGTDDEVIEKNLDIDGVSEFLLATLAIS